MQRAFQNTKELVMNKMVTHIINRPTLSSLAKPVIDLQNNWIGSEPAIIIATAWQCGPAFTQYN